MCWVTLSLTQPTELTRPEDFGVIATLNLNGDYLSDALAAQVGGIGIAPKYVDLDKVNPGSLILSGEMATEVRCSEFADVLIESLG